MTLSPEEWRPVPDWEDLYEISSHGRLKSLRSGKLRRLSPSGNGYYMGHLYRDGRTFFTYIHHLVALTFHGPRPEGYEIRHLDGDRLNNHADNLRYGTSSENKYDVRRHGNHHQAKKTHCPRGHSYSDPSNLITWRGGRYCRACLYARNKQYRARKQAERG